MTQFVNGEYLTPTLLNDKLASATTSRGFSTDTLRAESGNTVSAGSYNVSASRIRLTASGDAALASTTHAFQVGSEAGINIIMDENEIIARNNGATSTLNTQTDGGTLAVQQNVATGAAATAFTLGGGSGQIIAIRTDLSGVGSREILGPELVNNSAGGATGPILRFKRAKGTGFGASRAAVTTNDELLAIGAQGFDGTSYGNAAFLVYVADGTFTPSSRPGKIMVQTTPAGGTAVVNRWIFSSDGNLLAASDNSYDIGAAGATRPRDLHLARDQYVPGTSFVSSSTIGTGAPSTNTGKVLEVVHSGTADGNNQMAMFERTTTSSGAVWVNATQTRMRTTHSSGTLDIAVGVNGLVQVADAGSVSSARGVIGLAATTGGGNITHAVSVYADDPFASGGGSIENAYDFYGEGIDTGTNRCGLYLEDVTGGTSNHAIRTNAGNVHLGDALTFKAGDSTGTARALGVVNAANAVFTTSTGLTSLHSYSVRANTLEAAGDTLRITFQGYTISSMGTYALSLGSVTLISNLTVSADGTFGDTVWVTRRDSTHVDWHRQGLRFTGVTVTNLNRSNGSAVLDLTSDLSLNFSGSASAGTCFAQLAQAVLESTP